MTDEEVKIQIANAIDFNEVEKLPALLKAHPHMLGEETGVGTWLHYAAASGNLAACQFFVAQGIDVNSPSDPSGTPPETPVFDAVMSGSLDMVRWLLERGAKSHCLLPLQGNAPRNFALGSAITRGRLDMVQLLVEYGADVNVYFAGRTPLSQAEGGGQKEIAKYLRSKGAKLPAELGHGAPAKKAPSPKRKKS